MRRSELADQFEQEFANDVEALADGIVLDLVIRVGEEMDRLGLTAADLARKMGVSRQYVSRFLDAPGNTTVLTAVRFAQALGLRVRLTLEEAEESDEQAASARARGGAVRRGVTAPAQGRRRVGKSA